MCHCNWSIMVLQSCPCLRTIVSRPAHSPGYNISSKCLPQIGPGLTCLKKQGSHYCMCLIVDFHIGRWRGTEVVSLQPTRPPNCRPLSSSQQWMRICKDVWGYYFFFCLWLFFTGSLRPSPSVIEPTKTLLSPIMDVFLTLTRDFFCEKTLTGAQKNDTRTVREKQGIHGVSSLWWVNVSASGTRENCLKSSPT